MSTTNEKIVTILQKLIIPAASLIVVALIASGVFYIIDKNQKSKIAQSSDALFLIKKEATKISEAWKTDVKDEKVKDVKEKAVAKKVVSAEEKKVAYAPVVEKLMSHIKANQGHQVAVEGALFAADLGNEYNDQQVGIDALNSALTGMSSNHFLYAIGQSELGSLLAKADKCSEAAQVWEKVAVIKEHAYIANNLRLKAGVCYEKIGMFEKAEKSYQEVIDKSPNSSSARTAKKFLLHIKFVKNKGEADAGNKKTNG